MGTRKYYITIDVYCILYFIYVYVYIYNVHPKTVRPRDKRGIRGRGGYN